MFDKLQEAEKLRQEAVVQIRQDNCQKSQRALGSLTAKARVRVNMPDGTQRMLPEEERQQRITQAQAGRRAQLQHLGLPMLVGGESRLVY